MTSNYIKYFKEIKNRFILVFLGWLCCFCTCYCYKETILFILVNSNKSFLKLGSKPYFIFTNVTEIFYVYFDLLIFISNQIAVITFLYQSLMFLSLGLYQFEFIKMKTTFQVFMVSWALSSILLFKLIVPFSWNFFLSFQENSSMTQSVSLFFEAKLNEYFRYFVDLYYICLASCQFLAVLVIVLTNLSERLKKTKTFRKLFYLIFVIFSTVVTPPDVLSQISISCFLIITYEFLIFLKELKTSMVTN